MCKEHLLCADAARAHPFCTSRKDTKTRKGETFRTGFPLDPHPHHDQKGASPLWTPLGSFTCCTQRKKLLFLHRVAAVAIGDIAARQRKKKIEEPNLTHLRTQA